MRTRSVYRYRRVIKIVFVLMGMLGKNAIQPLDRVSLGKNIEACIFLFSVLGIVKLDKNT